MTPQEAVIEWIKEQYTKAPKQGREGSLDGLACKFTICYRIRRNCVIGIGPNSVRIRVWRHNPLPDTVEYEYCDPLFFEKVEEFIGGKHNSQ